MSTLITGAPFPVRLGGTFFSVMAPGCKGSVAVVDSKATNRSGFRKIPLVSVAPEAEIKVLAHLEIELNPAIGQQSGSRGVGGTEPELIVPVAAGNSYATLCTDEFDQSVWMFPKTLSAQQVTFSLPMSEATSSSGNRGVVTRTMRSLVSVVSWAVAPAIGNAARTMVAKWEDSKRPYGIFQVKADGTLSEPDWSVITSGPALLLIHGTFSTPQVGFAGWLGSSSFHALAERYGGRVLAFAHPSLSASPQENVDWLLAQLPEHIKADTIFDIVSHSRGGLVARELVSRGDAAPKIARVCLVGTPNDGTPLADVQHWTTFLNTHTSLLNVLPDSSVTVLMEGLLCLVKILGSSLAGGLPGLAAMDPGSQWLRECNTVGASTAWYTIGAAYQPDLSSKNMLGRFNNQAIQGFFAATNDLVVPTEGCHRSIYPPADTFIPNGGLINHCNYFEFEDVQTRLTTWLS